MPEKENSVVTTDYPEHKKLKAVEAKKLHVTDFLEWLQERHWFLAKQPEGDAWPTPIQYGIRKILAQYLEIDEDRLEAEKQHMLDEHCKMYVKPQ